MSVAVKQWLQCTLCRCREIFFNRSKGQNTISKQSTSKDNPTFQEELRQALTVFSRTINRLAEHLYNLTSEASEKLELISSELVNSK